MSIKLVTDSTCDLPAEVAERWGITVIPCNIHFGDDVYKDGIDIGPDEFYGRLVSSARLPTTAQPSMNDFLQVYTALAGEGHDVVSIHLSAKFSGTLNSATQAREALLSTGPSGAGRIEIIDSQMTSAGLGLVALLAARLISEGSSYEDVISGVRGTLSRVHCYFLLDTLEYLQKGGRIGKASAFLGSILSIKSVLTIKDGEAHPVERVRTRERGLQRMLDIVTGLAPTGPMAVLHSTTPDEAESFKLRLAGLGSGDEIIMARFGPVVGTYLGPGALGVGVISSH